MDPKTITVIIPVYKVEEYLESCVRSVMAQTWPALEILLVDDGSPDGCPALCDRLAGEDGRVRVIHKENGGLSSARNAGLDAARGEYVAFIDSDDRVAPTMLERLYAALSDAGAQLALCGYRKVDETGADVMALPPMPAGTYTPEELCRTMEAAPLYWPFITACNKLYARALFDGLRFPPGKLNEDEFVALPVFERCRAIAVVDEALYFYLERSGSIMNGTFTVRSLDGVEAYMGQYRAYRRRGWDDLAPKPLRRAYTRLWQCLRDVDVRAERAALRPWLREVGRELLRRDPPRAALLWGYYLFRFFGGR